LPKAPARPSLDAINATCRVRPAVLEDAAEVARLSGQLGYPVDADALRRRFARVLGQPEHLVLVGESDDRKPLAGWVHAFAIQAVESEFRIEIAGLVVDEKARRKGVGKSLVEQVELWAARCAADSLTVRCNVKRRESHAFYEALGYANTKTQTVFRKKMIRPT
jgi:GNAT superfamily N-acetyltransferase